MRGGVGDERFSSRRGWADVQPWSGRTNGDGGGAADVRGCFRGCRRVNFNRLLQHAWLLPPRPFFCLVGMMLVVLDWHVWLSVNNSSVTV